MMGEGGHRGSSQGYSHKICFLGQELIFEVYISLGADMTTKVVTKL